MTDLARDETPAAVSDEQLAEWERVAAELAPPDTLPAVRISRVDRLLMAVPLLVRALRDARDEIERLTHLGAVHHADVGEWRAERDTWRDRALQAEARAGRIQTELNEARAADHDHKLLADEWWRKCVAAEHCLAELAKSAGCLDTVEGVLGARLVCIRPSGHTGEHASVAGARWSPAAPTGQEAQE